MLSPKDAIDPIVNSGNAIRNPMVSLPISDEELQQVIDGLDAVLITHTHGDHWDPVAQARLPKDLTLLCQPEDRAILEQQGLQLISYFIDKHGQSMVKYSYEIEPLRETAWHLLQNGMEMV
jgi:glyoxylase-like metal-dependent hydrolase (beta-lactamase superfamily II)